MIFHKKFNCSPSSYISELLHVDYFRDLAIFNSTIFDFQGLWLGRFSYIFLNFLSYHRTSHEFPKPFESEKNLQPFQFVGTLYPSGWEWYFFKKIVYLLSELFCCIMGTFQILSWKMSRKRYRNYLFISPLCLMWTVAGENSKDAMAFFLNIFCSGNKVRWRHGD